MTHNAATKTGAQDANSNDLATDALERLADRVIDREDRVMEFTTRLASQRETWSGLETAINEVIRLVDGCEVKAGARTWRVVYIRDSFAQLLYLKPARPLLETTSLYYNGKDTAPAWRFSSIVDPQKANGTWKLFEDELGRLTKELTK